MSNLVPSTGTARLAAVLAGHVGGKISQATARSQIELGTIVDLGGGVLAVQPDSWSAAPFETFLMLQPLDRGLLSTEPTATGDHGDHSHALHDPLLALQAGDRVLLVWIATSPLVIGRVA